MTVLVTQFTAGDHIEVYRALYWHHGIYVGDNMVIHFDGEPGGTMGDARIKRRHSMSLQRVEDQKCILIRTLDIQTQKRSSVPTCGWVKMGIH